MSADDDFDIDGGRRFRLKLYAGILALLCLAGLWALARGPGGGTASGPAGGEVGPAPTAPSVARANSPHQTPAAADEPEPADPLPGERPTTGFLGGPAQGAPRLPTNWGGLYDDFAVQGGTGGVGGLTFHGPGGWSGAQAGGSGHDGSGPGMPSRSRGPSSGARPQRPARLAGNTYSDPDIPLKIARTTGGGDDRGDTQDQGDDPPGDGSGGSGDGSGGSGDGSGGPGDVLLVEDIYTGDDPPGGGDGAGGQFGGAAPLTTPEPATLLLLIGGGGALLVVRRRRRA